MSRNARSRMGRAIKAAPSFSLDFTKGVLDPRLTFTRASGATYIDSTGVMQTAANNVPRFDYDPVTLAIRGLLIEEARTNVITLSNAFSNNGGGSAASVVQNAVSPTGATDAWTVTESFTTLNQYASAQIVTVGAGLVYAATTFVKAGTATRCQLALGSALTNAYANFSLTGAGSVLASGGASLVAGSPDITAVGGGWYRIAMAFTASAATGVIVVSHINADASSRLPTYLGTGLTMFVFGAQVELGAFPTSYIPTSGAAATRAADVATVNNLAPWLNPSAGTLCVEAIPPSDAQTSGFVRVLQLDDGTENNAVSLQRSTSAQRLFIKVGGVEQFTDGTIPTWANSTLGRAGVSYTQMALATAFNGGAPRTDSVAAVPIVNTLRLGSQVSTAPKWNGHIRAVDYYPVALDQQTLRRITSATEHPSPRRIDPDFSLHFLDGVLDSRVTFTRASGGTRINSAGVLETVANNVPRFDYDPITLACKGLLIEEARTNRCTTSTTVLALSGATTAIDAVNMFGVANAATTLTETLTTGLHYGSVGVNVAWVAGTVYSCTLFLSPGTADRAQLLFTTSGAVSTLNDYANFSLVGAGAVLAVGSSSSASIKRVSANVYACTVLLTSGGTLSAIPILVSHINSDTAPRGANYPGTGLTLVVHGAQVEAGAFPTSYIPTTGAAATRAADVATVTGIGSWFNANEGSAVAEFVPQASSVDAYAAVLSAGTGSSNRIQITARRDSGSTSGFAVVSGGAATVDMVLAANVAGAVTKLAASYKADDFKATINGATLVTDTAGALPATAPDRLTLGSRWAGDGVSALNGHIRHFDYYRQALPADFITELSR